MRIILCSILLMATAIGDLRSDEPKPPRLFESQELMEITLTGPWRHIMRNKSDPDRYPGQLSWTTEAGEEMTIEVEFATRGLTRRDRVCDFPPLKIWFDKESAKGTPFRGQSSLKMVTHCKRAQRYEEYYAKEYVAYRIYNLMTPYSFRVRPLDVAYQEAGSGRKPAVRFGFLIEDIDDVADRLGLKELDIYEVEPEELDSGQTARFAVFQYLIGNLDWAATGGPKGEYCCHNGKLIGTDEDERPVFAIPYDFDSSGLVDAEYAAVPRRLGVSKVTDRLYRGFCLHNDELPAVMDQLRAQQGAIMELLREVPELGNRTRSVAERFLRAFFDQLQGPRGVKTYLLDKCRD